MTEEMRQVNRIFHFCFSQRDERHHIHRSQPRMDAGLTAHVNQFQSLTRCGERCIEHIFRFSQKSEDTPVMITIPAVINQADVGKRLQDAGNRFDFIQIASFTEIRNTFDDFHVYT